MVQRQRACGHTDGAEKVHTITDLLQENIGEGIPIAALRVYWFCQRFFYGAERLEFSVPARQRGSGFGRASEEASPRVAEQ